MEKETMRFPAKGKQEDQQPTVDPKTAEEIAEALRGDKDVKFDLAHPVLPTDKVVNPTAFDKLLDEVEGILSARDEKGIKDLIKDKQFHRINLETIFSEYYSGRRKDPGGLKEKAANVIMAIMPNLYDKTK